MRPFNGYGPRLLGNEYGQVVAMMLQRAVRQGEIIVHGDGSQPSLTYVDDIVRGIEAAGFLDGLEGMILNLGSEEERTMLELAQEVAELVETKLANPSVFVTSKDILVTQAPFAQSRADQEAPELKPRFSRGWPCSNTAIDVVMPLVGVAMRRFKPCWHRMCAG